MRIVAIATILLALSFASAGAGPAPEAGTLRDTPMLVLFELPAHSVGLELDGATGRLWNAKKYRHLIRDWGPGYGSGDRAETEAAEIEAENEAAARAAMQRRLDQLKSREFRIRLWQRILRDTLGTSALRVNREEQEALRTELDSRAAPSAETVAWVMRNIAPTKGSRIRLRCRGGIPGIARTREGLLGILAPFVRELPATGDTLAPPEP
jgi:hypothetical protein